MEKENKLKKVWNKHKGEIITAGTIVTGFAVAMILSGLNNKSNKLETNNKLIEEPLDFGRDCLMTFTVEETGEVLGVIPVAESFVNDWKDLIPEINEADYTK